MSFLVSFLTRTGDGASKKRDKAFATSELTLGRGTDQTIHIRDPRTALEHAIISSRDGVLILRVLTLTGVMVNDKITRYTKLRTGDRVRIGENVLTIVESPEDFDFALTFELDQNAEIDSGALPVYKTRLSQIGLRPRLWVWLSSIVVLTGGLLIPTLLIVSPGSSDLLSSIPLPDDRWWLSGPLHDVHQSIGDDCSVCHSPFQRTPDQKCMNCHIDVQQHIAHDDNGTRDELSQRRCAQCHKEHNEPESLLRRDQIVCTDCHADIHSYLPQTSLRDVSGFFDGHANFYVSMLSPGQAADQWDTVRVALDDKDLQEQSGLKFPHSKHLAPEGIKGADGDVVLQCEDCHLPQAGGAVMRTMNMERDCQHCHRLDFEKTDPTRQALHAQTDLVLKDMEEYYAWRYLNGMEDVALLGIDETAFRRPGKITDRGARAKITQAAAARAMEVGEELIHDRTCSYCHEVKPVEVWPGSVVAPTRLTSRWLPKSQFGHNDHGVFECAECHAAGTSESSSDVLIPDVQICGDCHSGSDVTGKVTSTCIDCHGFHMDGKGHWPQ